MRFPEKKVFGSAFALSKLRREDLQPIIDKIIKKICGWRGRLLSYGAKIILLQTCIASIPMYLMSFIKFLKWAIKAITSQMAHFFWGNFVVNHKYHLAKLGTCVPEKDFWRFGRP